jgi:hypothetical protein
MLKPHKIIETAQSLEDRIKARFPGSGLSRISRDLLSLARQTSKRIDRVERPHWGLRLLLIAIVCCFVLLLGYLILQGSALKGSNELAEVLQGLDAMVNLTVLLGGAAFFISTIEARWKRGRALKGLHELRSIVHIIDMHQLAKDPSSDRPPMVGDGASGKRQMDQFELTRYLDYCSEMLSITAKCAALYAERLNDAVVVDTVGDIERLTSELSSKIWQKITMVRSLGDRDFPGPVSSYIPKAQSS